MTASTSPRNELPLVRPVSSWNRPRAQHEQDHDRGARDHPRAAGDALAGPPPEAVRLVGLVRVAGEPAGDRAVRPGPGRPVGDERPERAPAEDRQRGRQHREHEDHRQADAERADRPEPGGRVDVGEDQHEQRRHHREAGGEDRRAGGAERDPDRLVLVVVAAQLLPVSGDEQQRVVRAGAEHEHREDAAGLPVDRHARLGEQVAEPARGDLGEQHREERDRPEDRRAVDEDQQDQHEPARGEQQLAVDVAEDVDRVRAVAGRAGHLHLDAVAAQLVRLVPDVGDGVEERVAVVGRGLDRRDDEQRLAVLRRDRPARLLHQIRPAAVERLDQLPRVLLLGRPERLAVARDHGHRGRHLALRELLDLVDDRDRLRAAGEERRGLVLLRVLELAGVRAGEERDEQHHDEDDPLGAAARRNGQDAGHGAGAPVTGKGGLLPTYGTTCHGGWPYPSQDSTRSRSR